MYCGYKSRRFPQLFINNIYLPRKYSIASVRSSFEISHFARSCTCSIMSSLMSVVSIFTVRCFVPRSKNAVSKLVETRHNENPSAKAVTKERKEGTRSIVPSTFNNG